MKGAPTTPLFLQALGLVGATLVAVFVATTLVVLNVPPPAPDIYTVSEVAQVMRTGKPAQAAEGRMLEVRTVDHPPRGVGFGRRHAAFRTGLADLLKINPSQIVLVQNLPPLMISIGGPPRFPRRPFLAAAASPDQTVLFGSFRAAVRQPDGRWLTVSPHSNLIAPWQ